MTNRDEPTALEGVGSTVVLGIPIIAWRRTDTPKTVVTENEDIVRLWEADGLFYEALVSKETADAEIKRLTKELEECRYVYEQNHG